MCQFAHFMHLGWLAGWLAGWPFLHFGSVSCGFVLRLLERYPEGLNNFCTLSHECGADWRQSQSGVKPV